jgi:phosphatidylethanolamine-binding protein (PEBP) family uncharacterized protein
MDLVHTKGDVVQRTLIAAVLLLLVSVLVAGCGKSDPRSAVGTSSEPVGTSSEQSPSTAAATSTPQPSPTTSMTSAQKNPSTHTTTRTPPATIVLSVLGLGPGPAYTIPKNNTCDGANTPLSLHWSAVPHGTAELALFIVNLRPVNERVFVDWAVTGLSPHSHGITAGALPAGAIAGTNGFGKVGYSICPPQGMSETYIARLVALAHPLSARPGFDDRAFYLQAEQMAKVVGVAGAGNYSR